MASDLLLNWPSPVFHLFFRLFSDSNISLIQTSSRAFERVPGKRLEGFDNKIIEQVNIVTRS